VEHLFNSGLEGSYGVLVDGNVCIADYECLSIAKSLDEGWWPPKYIVMREPAINENGLKCRKRLLKSYDLIKSYGEYDHWFIHIFGIEDEGIILL
jgi:hypothetical protein